MEFSETQKMKNPLVWVILLGNLVLFFVLVYYKLILKIDIGNHPAPLALLIIHFIMSLGLIIFFASMRLTLNINSVGISYSFVPLGDKEIFKWNDIEKITFIKDSYLKNAFVKNPPKKAVMFNITNSYGLCLELKGAKNNVIIGTSDLSQIKSIITEFASKDIEVNSEI